MLVWIMTASLLCRGGQRGAGYIRPTHMKSIDLLVVGNDDVVYTSWWHDDSADWSGINKSWQPIGGVFPIGVQIAAVSRTGDSVDLFIVGKDGGVYTSWRRSGAGWSGTNGWRFIGRIFRPGAPVSAVARTEKSIDLFVVGNDGVVYTSWWHDGADWSGITNNWQPIGGVFPIGAQIAAVSRTYDSIDLFIVGKDGGVYTSWWSSGAGWSGTNGWRFIGRIFRPGAPVSAVARTEKSIDLFVVGNDGVVYTSWWHDGADWSGITNSWQPIGGVFPIGAQIAAVSRTDDSIDLFIVGKHGGVYTSWWSSGAGWSGTNGWKPIGGTFSVSAPLSALSRSNDSIDLFGVGKDGVVYTSWWRSGAGWSSISNGPGWRPIGRIFPPGAPVSAI